MKKFICGILVGSICTLSIGTLATGIWDNISVLRNDIKVVVNGNKIDADNFLYNDTTYLPLRAVSEALNKTVEYDNVTNTAYIGERRDNNILNNNENNYTPPDFMLDDEDYIETINGKYYITIAGIEKMVNNTVNILCENIIDGQSCDLVFYTGVHYTEDSKEVFRYKITLVADRSIVPYDTFMEEIYPYIQ